MGGWTGEGKDTIYWDGTINAKTFNASNNIFSSGNIKGLIGTFGTAASSLKISNPSLFVTKIEAEGTDSNIGIQIRSKGAGAVVLQNIGSIFGFQDVGIGFNSMIFNVNTGSITSTTGTFNFGNENLTTTGTITGASLNAGDGFTGTGAYTNFTIVNGIITAAS